MTTLPAVARIIFLFWALLLFCALGSAAEQVSSDHGDGMRVRRDLQGGGGGGGGFGGFDDYSGYGGDDDLVPVYRVLLVIYLLVFALRCGYAGRAIGEQRASNLAWVRYEPSDGNRELDQMEMPLAWPSGEWRGYYHQYGRDHSLVTFRMRFDSPTNETHVGCVTGSGRDDVGPYEIFGKCHYFTGRLVFTKEYSREFFGSSENLGHSVEYRGLVQGLLAAGVRGSWFVATQAYQGTGTFHIWPVHPAQTVPTISGVGSPNELSPLLVQPSAPPETQHSESSTSNRGIFVSSENNECTICFDAGIDTLLHPCGHVAICTNCAMRLNHCPICRATIESHERCSSSETQLHSIDNVL